MQWGFAPNEYSGLASGGFIYYLNAYSLGLGFYLLFKSHSLGNAILYLGVFLSSFYSFVFPEYGRIGLSSPIKWHLWVWGAHFVMAMSAYLLEIESLRIIFQKKYYWVDLMFSCLQK